MNWCLCACVRFSLVLAVQELCARMRRNKGASVASRAQAYCAFPQSVSGMHRSREICCCRCSKVVQLRLVLWLLLTPSTTVTTTVYCCGLLLLLLLQAGRTAQQPAYW